MTYQETLSDRTWECADVARR